MENPETLLEIVSDADASHPSDIDAALTNALKRWHRRSEQPGWLDMLERDHVRRLIHESRHQRNRGIRNAAGLYGQPGKVGGTSDASNRAIASAFSYNVMECYRVGGRVLGDLTHDDLQEWKKESELRAVTETFHVKLASRLLDIVPKGKTVRQALKTKLVDSLFKELA